MKNLHSLNWVIRKSKSIARTVKSSINRYTGHTGAGKNQIDRNPILYPINIPEIRIEKGLDFLLLELPPRYMPMMPNGLAYVHNLLDGMGIGFQTVDSNIILYHRFHSTRLLHHGAVPVGPDGKGIEDPWDNTCTDFWADDWMLDFFEPFISELIEKVVNARPRILGVSLNGNNRRLAGRVINRIRKKLPNTFIVVGGYDCVYHDVATHLFQDFDYMIIREAELTLPPLIGNLLCGKKPKNLPGIISKWDTADRVWKPLPLIDDLDGIDFPKYQWMDTFFYQSYCGNHLIPITASRGCNWAKCRFCAECFSFRKRSPRGVVDEIEYMYQKGFHTFHFNESDVNGDPDNLYNICTEIIEGKLQVRLVGQLRVHKKNTEQYFAHLAKAGFKHLRFGVDGWSDKSLLLLNKGYSMALVGKNLSGCKKAGIHTTVNVVIGEPGETESDIEEIIENLIDAKGIIDKIESINTLILAAGSEYFKNPDKYNIRFRTDKRQIYMENPYFIPTNLWYSVNPYIDQEIRLNRLERILDALEKNDVPLGDFATLRVSVLRNRREPHKV